MENPVIFDEKKHKYNEYMKKYRQNNLEKSREASRANYNKRKQKLHFRQLLNKDIDLDRYSKEQLIQIEYLAGVVNDAKKTFPDIF